MLSAASPLAVPPITDWSNIETITVIAKAPGPALWRIAQGRSEVWVLATVAPVPENLQWDHNNVAALLKGARVLLLPPRGAVGLFEGAWFILTGLGTLEQPEGTTLASSLRGPLSSRFAAARIAVRQDADRYDKYLPAVAAVMLESDFWKANNLNFDGPQKTVAALARRLLVPARSVAVYPAMDVIHDVPKLSPAAQLKCLDDALNDIEIETAHAKDAAEAWATGDLAAIKANYSEIKLDSCLQQSNVYSALRERANGDIVKAITSELGKPGKSFAVVPMGVWLRKGGVLERLEASGLTISGPGD